MIHSTQIGHFRYMILEKLHQTQ